MMNRFNIWKFNYRNIEYKANRRLGKKDEDREMHVTDYLILLTLLVLIYVRPIPDSVPYADWICLFVALVIIFVLLFFRFRRQAPRTCWRNATWSTAMWALMMTVVPLLLYWLDEFPLDLTWQIIAASSVLWLVSLGCFMRLRYIRRRSREEIVRMRLREKRRRKLEYL